MDLMQWLPRYQLGCAPMDDTHREFVDWINRLAQLPDGEFLPQFDAFFAHTEHHFAQENQWMEESAFPPLHCHVGEHERVLATLRSLRKMVERGDVAIGRRAVEELVGWFDNHAATMDTALAVHMRNAQYTPTPLTATA